MDLTPPSHRSDPRPQSKPASRIARIRQFTVEDEEMPDLSLDLIPSSPKNTPSSSPLRSSNSLPIRELLLLSPSPHRRSRTRLAERHEAEELPEPTGSRRRCRNRGAQMGLLSCASPRSNRRPRKRSELETREEKELGVAEEVVKVRKRRSSGRSKKEKLSLVPVVPSSSSSPKMDDCGGGNLDRIGQVMNDLIMWKDVSKSTLWFGFGSICFLSSCFTGGLKFSTFSAVSRLGLLLLGASFFSNSIRQRNNAGDGRDLKLTEDDILRVARLILPATNLAISKTRDLFSGEPTTTLKETPLLLLGAEYGHLITLWWLSALAFFISFCVPKLYSNYSAQINQKVESWKGRVRDAWTGCTHKKIVAASVVTAFWNLSSVKTRIFTAFISLVIVRYCRQHLASNLEGEEEAAEEQEEQQHQALVVAKH